MPLPNEYVGTIKKILWSVVANESLSNSGWLTMFPTNKVAYPENDAHRMYYFTFKNC